MFTLRPEHFGGWESMESPGRIEGLNGDNQLVSHPRVRVGNKRRASVCGTLRSDQIVVRHRPLRCPRPSMNQATRVGRREGGKNRKEAVRAARSFPKSANLVMARRVPRLSLIHI